MWAHLVCTMYDKLVIAGNITSLGIICYIIAQLWYNGLKIIKSLKLRDFQPNLSAILRAFCCGVAAFVVSLKYAQVNWQQEDVEEGCQSSMGADGDLVSLPVMTKYSIGNRDKKVSEGSK